jgi:hypothetical protein
VNARALLLLPLKYLWALPCTLVGLVLAALAAPFGAQFDVEDGVLEVALGLRRQPVVLPFDAITFGHVVIGVSRPQLQRLRAHEHAHVRQYERWGLLFFAAYPLAGAWQWPRGKRAYFDNPFEVQARRHEP